MNKQTIITALLALIAMAGQGQVRMGLDLCLRDEATGEWLIGLFDQDKRPDLYREIPIYNLNKRLVAIDSLHLPPLLREIVIARTMTYMASHDVRPMEDYELQTLRENMHQPCLLDEVLRLNDQLIAARKAADAIVTPDPSPMGEGSIYTIDGKKLDKMPTCKGLYIKDGKKFMIK